MDWQHSAMPVLETTRYSRFVSLFIIMAYGDVPGILSATHFGMILVIALPVVPRGAVVFICLQQCTQTG